MRCDENGLRQSRFYDMRLINDIVTFLCQYSEENRRSANILDEIGSRNDRIADIRYLEMRYQSQIPAVIDAIGRIHRALRSRAFTYSKT